jgi:hypothetical protein
MPQGGTENAEDLQNIWLDNGASSLYALDHLLGEGSDVAVGTVESNCDDRSFGPAW